MAQRRRKQKSKQLSAQPFDYTLLTVVLFLLCIGLVMLYSVSSYDANLTFNDSTHYIRNQLQNTVIGVIAMFVVMNIDYHRLDKWSLLAYFVSAVLIALVLTPLGSGGVFGKGLGMSLQKQFVPEAQNDMIFAIICEELGLFGAVLIIFLFIVLVWRIQIIVSNASDLFGSMLAVGVMAHISIQVILNLAVVTNTIPNTGISLPFISYGGSSVVFLLIEIGMVLSVAKNTVYDNY